MRSAISGGRKALIAGVLLAGSAALSGCATEDYVDKHIAVVNARIDQTDGRLGALEGRVNEVSQKTDAAAAAAQAAGSAAQSAAAAAQTAGADAARANEAIEKMQPQVAHLWSHHNRKTWADHPNKKSKKRSKKSSKK